MDPLKLENQLCFPLYVAAKEVVRKYTPLLQELNLTYTQYIAMLVLWEEKEIRIKDLGDKLYLDSGTLTPLLKKLEKLGYIERKRSKSDERNVSVSLTKNGIMLKNKAEVIPQQIASCINLSEEEAVSLYQLLVKVINQTR